MDCGDGGRTFRLSFVHWIKARSHGIADGSVVQGKGYRGRICLVLSWRVDARRFELTGSWGTRRARLQVWRLRAAALPIA